MFDSGIHHQNLCVPCIKKLNLEYAAILNSGKNSYRLELFLMVFAKIYDMMKVEHLTKLYM